MQATNVDSPATLPLRRRRNHEQLHASEELVNQIRERYHIDGLTIQAIAAELPTPLSYPYVYAIAIGDKRRNVPYSQRMLDWFEATGRSRAVAGLD